MISSYRGGNNMGNHAACILLLLCLLFVLPGQDSLAQKVNAIETTKQYIIYLGEKPHDDHDLITDSHHDLLANVFDSKEEAKASMLYSYRYSFSGFSARLSVSQAKKIAELPGVVKVMKNRLYSGQTTRSWDFLGLSSQPQIPSNLLQKANMGDGVVIGIIDSGIWSNNSKAFSDEGLGPIPSHWKGVCKSEDGGKRFNASMHCNRKVIGFRWFVEGLKRDESGINVSALELSDDTGHGTHVASTAAGAYVNNINFEGLDLGTARGGAPKARLAIYKVCWGSDWCNDVDILAGFDAAVHDGVDIISASLGPGELPLAPLVGMDDGTALGSFHAEAHGIPVVVAAGNDGPAAQTVSNNAPWVITVAASTSDRVFPTPITLGNNKTIMGRGYFSGKNRGFAELHIAGTYKGIENLSLNSTEVAGKLVLYYFWKPDINATFPILRSVNAAGGLGLILAMPPNGITFLLPYSDRKPRGVPVIFIDLDAGNQIAEYCSEEHKPIAMLSSSKVVQGKPLLPKVATFSSRGPNPVNPVILKPDIAAPGADIIAATSSMDILGDNGFGIYSGTSMATPHISGIVALLKAVHPKWSPAAIRSALVTTAWNSETYGFLVFADGSSEKLADPFDYGGGIVNANGAADPGLVYDISKTDYIHYLCSLSYNNSLIYNATREREEKYNAVKVQTVCPKKTPSSLDLNLPSITIPHLAKSIIVKRTVTNVGSVDSVYRAVVKSPIGTKVVVRPKVLNFNSKTEKISFKVTITAKRQVNSGYTFGSLTWTDGGVHSVRIPISVKKQVISLY